MMTPTTFGTRDEALLALNTLTSISNAFETLRGEQFLFIDEDAERGWTLNLCDVMTDEEQEELKARFDENAQELLYNKTLEAASSLPKDGNRLSTAAKMLLTLPLCDWLEYINDEQ